MQNKQEAIRECRNFGATCGHSIVGRGGAPVEGHRKPLPVPPVPSQVPRFCFEIVGRFQESGWKVT